MEGPSLFLAQEQLAPFIGLKIISVSGNTKIGKERLLNKEVKDIFSWGKHLIIQFDTFAVRTHFLLFGTFEAVINGVAVTGDYQKSKEPRLELDLSIGSIKLFNCSIKIFENDNYKKQYDYSIDIMSTEWSSEKAFQEIRKHPTEEIGDILLDQTIFAGVGNIIKNEVLFLVRILPTQTVASISDEKVMEIVSATQAYSYQFYEWRKAFVLKQHFQIYRKKTCQLCGLPVIRKKTGVRQRWSYYSECYA